MKNNSEKIRNIKKQIKADPELSKRLLPSGRDEIMLDLNLDGTADLCLSSDHNKGYVNTFSVDVTGNGDFNLYFHDADGNGIPDTILWSDDDNDEMKVIDAGEGVEKGMIDLFAHLEAIMMADELMMDAFGVSLTDIGDYINKNLKAIGGEVDKRVHATGIEKVYYFLKDAGTYFLATVEGDQPRVRPFGTILLYEGKLYIQTGKVKDVSKQLAANPYAEVCAFKDGVWLRVSGKLVNDENRLIKIKMLDDYPSLKSMYDPADDNTQVLYFKSATAKFYTFGAAPEQFEF